MRFYRFDIFETKKRISFIENNLPITILEKLHNMPGDTLDKWVSTDHLISYVYINETDLDFFINVFFDNEIKFEFNDVTFDVITDNIDFDDTEFDLIKQDYINSNLTVDIVLDKINLHGIESLSEYDRQVLSEI